MRFVPLVSLLFCCCIALPSGPACDKVDPPELDLTVSAALYPDGDISVEWTGTFPASPTTHWTKIDEGVGSHDSGSTYNTSGGVSGANKIDKFSLQNVPADVGTITKIEWRVAARWVAGGVSPDYDFGLDFDFYTGSTSLGYGGFTFAGVADSAWAVFGWYDITSLSLTKVEGDDLRVWCYARLPDPPAKNDRVQITAFEYRVTYTPAAIVSTSKHKMDIGLGMRPGLR